MHVRTALCALLCALAACQPAAMRETSFLPERESVSDVMPRGCQNRVNDTVQKIEQCIQRASLWQPFVQFQKIADANPGKPGHGNRDTGTPGYAASVAYVA